MLGSGGVSTFAHTSATLDLSTGFQLGLGPGTNQVVTEIDGWYRPAPMRRPKTERRGAHGNFSERGWKDERVVSLSGAFLGTSRAEAAAYTDQINAFLADGTEGLLTVSDADLGTRFVRGYLDGTPDVQWNGGEIVKWTVDIATPDPRKYGSLSNVETGPPQDGGGLVYPLYAGEFAVSRTNLALNPSVEVDTSGYTGGNSTIAVSAAWAAVGTKSLAVTSSGSTSDCWASAGGDLGAMRLGMVAGKTYTVSATVYTPSALTGAVLANSQAIWFFYKTSAGYFSVTSPKGPATGSARVSVTVSIPEGATEAFIRLYNGSPTAGEVVYWDAVLVEESGTAGPYFDGSTAPADGKAYVWSGTAHNSTSTESVPVAGSAYGVLDYGSPGSTGIIEVFNLGTAESPPQAFKVTGYTPSFTITELDTGRRLVYTGAVPNGSELVIDPHSGTAKLDGSDRGQLLTVREWVAVPPGGSSRFLFESSGVNSRLTIEGVSAWW